MEADERKFVAISSRHLLSNLFVPGLPFWSSKGEYRQGLEVVEPFWSVPNQERGGLEKREREGFPIARGHRFERGIEVWLSFCFELGMGRGYHGRGRSSADSWRGFKDHGELSERHVLMAIELGHEAARIRSAWQEAGADKGVLLLEWVEDEYFARYGRYSPQD